MPKVKKYTYNGKSLTLVEWSREIDIPYITLYNRLSKLNWSVEEAFSTPLNRKIINKEYTYNGKTLTLKEWSKEINIPYNILSNRLNGLNWSIEKTFSTPVVPRKLKKYNYKGKSLTLSQLEKETGIPYVILRYRLNKMKWSLEKTLTTPVNLKSPVEIYTYDGKSLTLSDWSKLTGIEKGTLFKRLKTFNWSIEKTLTTPLRNKKYTYNGKSLTLSEWSKETGLNRITLVARIEKRKWSLERALTTPAKQINKKYTYDGKSLTLTEWSNLLGVNKNTLVARIENYNWSLERALTTPTRPKNQGKTKG